jgi:hypothetical protein
MKLSAIENSRSRREELGQFAESAKLEAAIRATLKSLNFAP